MTTHQGAITLALMKAPSQSQAQLNATPYKLRVVELASKVEATIGILLSRERSLFVYTTCVGAAVDNRLNRANFSNYGPHVNISAPGVGIVTTAPVYKGKLGNLGEYDSVSGTSFSCPIVSGVLGLLLSSNPRQPRQKYLDCLYSTARDISKLPVNKGAQLCGLLRHAFYA
eukprot:6213498-Pleurochrysis_carterae.AAC.2